MSDITFTQEQLNEAIENAKQEWIEQELNPIVAERDNLLQFKPVELSDEEKQLQQLQQSIFNREVAVTLKENGLEAFSSVIKVDSIEELNDKMEALKSALGAFKVDNSYVPTDHKSTDKYSQAKSKGDTLGMIKALFS